MRILFLTQVLPYPLDAGPKIRAYYVLRHLAQQHQVTLISFVRPNDTPEAIAHLESFCEQVITLPMPRSRLRDVLAMGRSLANREPFLITRDWVPEMEAALHTLLAEGHYDAVHADQLWMAQYALQVASSKFQVRNPQSAFRLPRLVLDQHNAVFQIPQRMAQYEANPLKRVLLKLEWRKLARYEAQVCQQFDHVVWVTQEDLDAVQAQTQRSQSPIRNLQPATCNSIIPICIAPQEVQPITLLTNQPNLLFLGGMHWPPNAEGVRWFVSEIWPRVREQIPAARLQIIGKSPPPELSLAPGVIAPGYVDDVTPYWCNSRAFIVPLRAGGGMRVKILDAWARGLPVISTTIGAEGIKCQDGEDILIADTPGDFANAVVRVLSEEALAPQLAQGGRSTVEAHYDWRKVYTAWDDIYSPGSSR